MAPSSFKEVGCQMSCNSEARCGNKCCTSSRKDSGERLLGIQCPRPLMRGWMQPMRSVVVLACPNFSSRAGETTKISLLKAVTYAWLSYASPSLRKRRAWSCGTSSLEPSGRGYLIGETIACGWSDCTKSFCWQSL
eukprot:5221306-Amphidinium_carterae.1